MTDRVSKWQLEKYARCISAASSTSTNAKSSWLFVEGSDGNLRLSLSTSHQLLITSGDKIQENHSLWNAVHWMKGLHKGDSLLIMYKVKGESRRFRVKFAATSTMSAVNHCLSCVKRLACYFTFRHMDEEAESQPKEGSIQQSEVLQGGPSSDVPLATLARISSGELKVQLPQAYHTGHIPTEGLQTFVRLCLADSNFPAFVGQVEKELQAIAKEST